MPAGLGSVLFNAATPAPFIRSWRNICGMNNCMVFILNNSAIGLIYYYSKSKHFTCMEWNILMSVFHAETRREFYECKIRDSSSYVLQNRTPRAFLLWLNKERGKFSRNLFIHPNMHEDQKQLHISLKMSNLVSLMFKYLTRCQSPVSLAIPFITEHESIMDHIRAWNIIEPLQAS